ncbi:MAG: helix-turn-helix transcriptional regulator [Rhodobacteraceae bacterium]|jgi:DNA-binding CsgD family transcriptional regulator|nr:helix-turn-helix transcriptional regulator [Paracoccaceae bacterium]
MTGFAQHLAWLSSASTDAARWSGACLALADLGADWVTVGSAPVAAPGPVRVRTSTPDPLMRAYIAAGLDRRDRWLQHCATSDRMESTDLAAATFPAVRKRVILPELAQILGDHGVRRVALVPAGAGRRIEAVVVYATSADGAAALLRAEASGELAQLAALTAAFCAQDAGKPAPGGMYRFCDLLSPREREVLLWLAAGLRTAQIAHRMGIEPVTVGLHLRGARRKLGARTREQALAIALRDGHIDP